MRRSVEPELMDEPLQVQAYAQADIRATDQALVERLVEIFGESLGDGPGPQLVDLGCCPGNISDLAQRALGCPGLADRLGFAQVLLGPKTLPYGGFTAVLSNNLLHHLHDPQALWRHLRQLAAPGAAIFIKDLRRPANPEAALVLQQMNLASAPPVLQWDYLAFRHAAFEPAEVEAWNWPSWRPPWAGAATLRLFPTPTPVKPPSPKSFSSMGARSNRPVPSKPRASSTR